MDHDDADYDTEMRLGCLHQTLERGDWDLSLAFDVGRVLETVERLVNYVKTGEKSIESNVRKLSEYTN